jgi:hypothetical protein
LYKILHFSPRETRANDRVRVVLFRKEARKKHHVVVVFVVSSSQNDVRSLSFFSLSVSLATREAFQLFLKRTRVGNILRPSVAFGAQTERRFIRNHREKKHLFFIRTLSSSSNFVAHYSLFLLTQYIRRPVRVDDAKT